jgi:hypothetical protein
MTLFKIFFGLEYRMQGMQVKHDLVRPRRPELEAEMSVFNLAQKRSFPPLCLGGKTKNLKGDPLEPYGHV